MEKEKRNERFEYIKDMKTFEQFIQSEPKREYWLNGNIKEEIWKNEDGDAHREGGPAVIYYYNDGSVKTEEYHLNDKKHREDGPAEIEYYINGNVKSEIWYKEGKLHREEGPSVLFYEEKGNIQKEQFWLYHILYSFEGWLEELKDINPEEYERQKKKKEFKNLNI